MKTINERILFMITHFCEGNKSEFARLMNEKPQTISGWLKRSNGINVTNKILNKFPMVSPTWLITGDGNMIADDANERIKDAMARETDPFVPFDFKWEVGAPSATEATDTVLGSAGASIGKGLASVMGTGIASAVAASAACATTGISGLFGSLFGGLFSESEDLTDEEAIEVLKSALEDHKRISTENEELREEVEYWRDKANNLEYQLAKTKAG